MPSEIHVGAKVILTGVVTAVNGGMSPDTAELHGGQHHYCVKIDGVDGRVVNVIFRDEIASFTNPIEPGCKVAPHSRVDDTYEVIAVHHDWLFLKSKNLEGKPWVCDKQSMVRVE